MAPRQCVGLGAAGVSGPPHLAWHPRMMPGAAPRSPSPSPASVVVPAPCGTSSLLFAKHFGPLLTVPQHQGIRQAVCCFVAVPVDVFEDACQHGAPLAIPWQLRSTPYKQGSVIDGPSKVLKVADVIQIHSRHSIRHAMLFHPSSTFCAAQRSKTEDFICHYQFLIDPAMALYLVINVEELIQGVEQHFWSVALPHDILMPQGVMLHGGCLKAHNALRLMLPVLLRRVGESPPKPPLSNLQATTSKH